MTHRQQEAMVVDKTHQQQVMAVEGYTFGVGSAIILFIVGCFVLILIGGGIAWAVEKSMNKLTKPK